MLARVAQQRHVDDAAREHRENMQDYSCGHVRRLGGAARASTQDDLTDDLEHAHRRAESDTKPDQHAQRRGGRNRPRCDANYDLLPVHGTKEADVQFPLKTSRFGTMQNERVFPTRVVLDD